MVVGPGELGYRLQVELLESWLRRRALPDRQRAREKRGNLANVEALTNTTHHYTIRVTRYFTYVKGGSLFFNGGDVIYRVINRASICVVL